jgi:hypothetical protein
LRYPASLSAIAQTDIPARLAGKFAYMFFRRFFAGGRGNKVGAIA